MADAPPITATIAPDVPSFDGPGGPRDDGDDGDPGERWVTCATFWSPPEAHIARLRLEGEGIDCFLFDENIVATDWGIANAAGGIKLKVRESDLSDATQALQTACPLPEASSDSESPASDDQGDDECNCPACGSTETWRDGAWRRPTLTVLLAAMFFLPLLLVLPWLLADSRPWSCMRCGHRWGRRGFAVGKTSSSSKWSSNPPAPPPRRGNSSIEAPR